MFSKRISWLIAACLYKPARARSEPWGTKNGRTSYKTRRTNDYYAQHVRQGATLITLQANEARVEEIMSIMTRYKPINMECALV